MKNEKWMVVKKGNGKFSPRYSNNESELYWPFGELGKNVAFDTLDDAIRYLEYTKKIVEMERMESEETVVFELL